MRNIQYKAIQRIAHGEDPLPATLTKEEKANMNEWLKKKGLHGGWRKRRMIPEKKGVL